MNRYVPFFESSAWYETSANCFLPDLHCLPPIGILLIQDAEDAAPLKLKPRLLAGMVAIGHRVIREECSHMNGKLEVTYMYDIDSQL